jgi:hypothetical protein
MSRLGSPTRSNLGLPRRSGNGMGLINSSRLARGLIKRGGLEAQCGSRSLLQREVHFLGRALGTEAAGSVTSGSKLLPTISDSTVEQMSAEAAERG